MRFDPRLLTKAVGPGRIRDAVLKTWARVRQEPRRSGPVLRSAGRRFKHLHSRERRLFQEGLFGLVRRQRGLGTILGTDAPVALWTGWLVLEGLDPEVANDALPGPWHGLEEEFDALGVGGPPATRLALRHSLPDHLAKRIVKSLGSDAEAFMVASDQRGPLTLRANRLRCTRDALIERLEGEGITTAPTPHAPEGLIVEGRHNLEALASFKDGWFEVQDEGSQRLANLVEPIADGQTVVDFCAGAGGKSLAIAAKGAHVTALDVRAEALEELDRRASRAGAHIAVTRIATRGPLPPEVAGLRADCVLVDAPCTGTGVLRRHPEHRYLIERSTVSKQAELQGNILTRAASLVAEGGRLIYGTCSVLRAENDAVVERFLARHPSFEPVGEALRTAPHTDGSDGFYGRVLEKGW
ncbi:MAG: RsmB/NOP family class I SAM-dependent RNA methyltransferase [Myxococcota bacterium]